MQEIRLYTLLGLLRILMGWLFLWTFLDKTFGLGFATTAEKAWIAGGSPNHAARKRLRSASPAGRSRTSRFACAGASSTSHAP